MTAEQIRHDYTLKNLFDDHVMYEKLLEVFTNEVVGEAEGTNLPDIPSHVVWRDNITLARHDAMTVDVVLLSGDKEMLIKAYDALATKRAEKINDDSDQPNTSFEAVAHGLIAQSQKQLRTVEATMLNDFTENTISQTEMIARQARITHALSLLDAVHDTLCPETKQTSDSLRAEERMARYKLPRQGGNGIGISFN